MRVNSKISNLAEKVLERHVTIYILRHSSATYWAPKMNRYQFCTKYGWAFSSDMPDRYIERKGIIFNQIAEKGDTDQTTKLQKKQTANGKSGGVRRRIQEGKKTLEFVMELVEDVGEEMLKGHLFKKRKEQLMEAQAGYTN